MTVDSVQRVMRTLGDPTRLRILALLEREELAVQDLVRLLGSAQSTVSRHLALLKDADLLRERRDGTFCYTRFVPPTEGPWADAWALVRHALRDDPQVAADADALEAILRARTLGRREFFDALGPEWDRLRQVFQDDLQRARAISRLIPRGLRVADIGTGTGILALELARLGVQVVAVDQSETMLAAAGQKLAAAGVLEHVDLRHGSAVDLPIESDSVDAVLGHMVLHYVASPLAAIREMARVLRPRGRVVIVDFASDDERPQPDREWMRKDLGVLWQGFSPNRIRDWLHDAGLTAIEVELHEPVAADRDLPATFIASADRTDRNRE
ncbi:MAG: metalloregulator ArsR/SmtB family transcription factor [Planctomycetes bacterium]|nr:metalloregulator ArsR/SmtB family transcription factor [Planctomycetota bacterium]